MKLFAIYISLLIYNLNLVFSQSFQEFDRVEFVDYQTVWVEVYEKDKRFFYHLEANLAVDELKGYNDHITIAVKDGNFGAIHTKGQLILPFDYDEINLEFEYKPSMQYGENIDSEFLIFKKNGSYGVADSQGEILLNPVYQEIRILHKNAIAFKENNLWGWANGRNGEIIQKAIYDDLYKFHSDEFVEMEKDGLFGLAKWDGTPILPVQFSGYLTFFQNNQKFLFQGKSGNFNQLYDPMGKMVMQSSNSIIDWISPDLVMVENNQLKGIAEISTQKQIIPIQYQHINKPVSKLLIVKKNNKLGVMNFSGKTLLPSEFDAIRFINANGREIYSDEMAMALNADFSQIQTPEIQKRMQVEEKVKAKLSSMPYYILAQKGSRVYLYDWQGKSMLPDIHFNRITTHLFQENVYFLANAEGKLQIYNAAQKLLFEDNCILEKFSVYDGPYGVRSEFNDQIRYLKLNYPENSGKSIAALFDLKQEKIIIPKGDQNITWEKEQFFKVYRYLEDYKRALDLYDLEGKKRLSFGDDTNEFHVLNGDLVLVENTNYNYQILNLKGEKIYENPTWKNKHNFAFIRFPEYKNHYSGDFYHGLKKIFSDETQLFIDANGKEIRFSQFDQVDAFYEGAAIAAYESKTKNADGYFDRKFGMIDPKGKILLPIEFDDVFAVGKNSEYLKFRKGNLYGIYSRNGKVLLEPIYEQIQYISDYSTIIVSKNDKYGMMDLNGKIIVPAQFDEIKRNYNNDHKTWPLMVTEKGWKYFINSNGKRYAIRSKSK